MSVVTTLRARLHHFLRFLFRRDQVEHELRQELAQAVDLLVEQKIAEGLSRRQARRAAKLQFGSLDLVTEQVRDVRIGAWIEHTDREIRRCLRSFVRNPLFTGVAVLTLALGVGAAIALFTLVNAVLLRPLPFPDADRLVTLAWSGNDGNDGGSLGFSGPLYFRYADESRTLDAVAAYGDGPANFTDPDDPQRVAAAAVTPALFDVLQTPPRLGRALAAADVQPDAPPVVVLGDAVWRTRFGADPGVVGRIVDIDATRTEVVGVMPPGFTFPGSETALWRPLRIDRETTQLGDFFYRGVARLADGVAPAQGQAELQTLVSNLSTVFPDQYAAPFLEEMGFQPLIVPLHEVVVGHVRTTLWVLLGAVGILLLIASVNVANLFLVRSEARVDEWVIRYALGAHRRWLAGAVFLESLLIGLAGGAAALPLAWLAVQMLVRTAPRDLPRLDEVSMDGSVLLFGLVASIAAGLVCGLLPAWRASAVGTANLPAGTRGTTDGRDRQLARRGLVVAQISLALTLLVGSGLAVRSFQRLAAVDPGFDPAGALTFGLALPDRAYATPESRLAFHRRMVERLRGLPGVTGAAAATGMPLTGFSRTSDIHFEGRGDADGVRPVLPWKQVSPGYFQAMDVEMVDGRDFNRLDAERAPVAIVSRSLAETWWPGEPVLGKGIRPGGLPVPAGDGWFRIVGVVEDVHETALHEAPPAMGYYPLAYPLRFPDAGGAVQPSMRYVVRGPNAAALTAGVREVVRSLDRGLPISDVSTLEALVDRARAQRAFVMVLLMVAAVFALLLAAIGLYGVIAYMVTRRRREIAVRMAVGAQVGDIRRLVLKEAGGLALAGAALGAGAAAALTRQLQALLFETSPFEPPVFAAVAALLVAICLFASWLPARRATHIDPMSALRVE